MLRITARNIAQFILGIKVEINKNIKSIILETRLKNEIEFILNKECQNRDSELFAS
ncbi:hypothetical protein JUNP499_2463 [Acinetobacter baumannii]